MNEGVPETQVENIEGPKRIIACFYEEGTTDDKFFEELVKTPYDNGLRHVEWGIHPEVHNMQRMLHGGKETYVISDIGIENKYSKGYGPCTGIVAVGTSKASGENISMMTHQVPSSKKEVNQMFEEHLRQALREIQSRAEEGSVDIVMYGGLVSVNVLYNHLKMDLGAIYQKIKEDIFRICREEIGVEARAILDPKEKTGSYDDVYFDTKERRLYIRREVNN